MTTSYAMLVVAQYSKQGPDNILELTETASAAIETGACSMSRIVQVVRGQHLGLLAMPYLMSCAATVRTGACTLM